jgi:hypothetical protein
MVCLDEYLRECGRFNWINIEWGGFDGWVSTHLPDAFPNLWIKAVLDIIIRSTSIKHYLLGNSLAISLHLVPYILSNLISCKSYSSDQEEARLVLSRWLSHLSLHCFPLRLVISYSFFMILAMLVQFLFPYTLTNLSSIWSYLIRECLRIHSTCYIVASFLYLSIIRLEVVFFHK